MNKYEQFLVDRRIASDRVYPQSEAQYQTYEEYKEDFDFDFFDEVLGG